MHLLMIQIACDCVSMSLIIYGSTYLSTSLVVMGFGLGVAGSSSILIRIFADKFLLPITCPGQEVLSLLCPVIGRVDTNTDQ